MVVTSGQLHDRPPTLDMREFYPLRDPIGSPAAHATQIAPIVLVPNDRATLVEQPFAQFSYHRHNHSNMYTP